MGKKIEFKKPDGKTYRIVGLWRWEREYGYSESTKELYNVLQVRKQFLFIKWWSNVDAEHVPVWAWAASATLGYTEWRSKLLERHGF